MKGLKILGVALAVLGATSFSNSQEIRKEVNVEVENGEHIMTITTTDKEGKIMKDEYRGAAAKEKMHEMHKNIPEGAHIEKRIVKDITDEEGNHMIIKKTCDGEKSEMKWKHKNDISKEEMDAFHEKMKVFHETLTDKEKEMMHHKMRMQHGSPEMHQRMMRMHKDMSPEDREKFRKEMREMHEDLPAGQAGMVDVHEKDGKVIININGEEQVIDISDAKGMNGEGHKMIFITEDEDGEEGMKMKKEIIIITRNVRIKEDKSLKNNLKGVDFKTYPNPNNGNFNIELKLDGKKQTYFTITDLNGKQIYKGEIDVKEKGVYTQPVKMEDMPKGTYLIQVIQGKKAATKKVIIE